MADCKTAFVTFFPISPNNMGSSAVVNSRFKSWPNNKKIFQISHISKINNGQCKTIFINKEGPINKILKLPKLIFEIYKYLKKSKKKILLIEGASWIFYSFFTIFFIKIIFAFFYKITITLLPGNYCESVIPDPISNSAVKPFSANGTLS